MLFFGCLPCDWASRHAWDICLSAVLLQLV